MAAKKYYVVWEGVEPGIYESWTDCQLQIKGYPGARYASFKTLEEAKAAYDGNYDDYRSGKPTKSKKAIAPDVFPSEVDRNAWAVDAACAGNPGVMEYQGVMVKDRSEIFHLGPFPLGTNNIGEFLAIVHAAALLQKKGDTSTVIYTDSRTALAWIRHKKARTNLVKNNKTRQLYELIARAETWLKVNEIPNEIRKWDTDNWGEIPADFGRK